MQQTENKPQNNNSKIYILLGVLVLVVIALIVVLMLWKKDSGVTPGSRVTIPERTATTSESEVAPSKDVIDVATVTPEVLEKATSSAAGTNRVTEDNIVITEEGAPVKLNVMPSDVAAPKESAPISLEDVKDDANTVKLSVSAAGFEPKEFRVKQGQLVNFTLTSTDGFTHVWLPDDMALIGTALGVAAGETRMKSWNAPARGEYTFRCDIPGHASRGETGKMIVE